MKRFKSNPRNRKLLPVLLCLILPLLSVLAACSNTAKDQAESLLPATEQWAAYDSTGNAGAGLSVENYALMQNAKSGEEVAEASADGSNAEGRYVTATASVDLQTRMYDAFVSSIQAKLDEVGGYIESNNEYNYDSGRNAYYVIRVPAERLDAFLDGLSANATVISRSVQLTDITDNMIQTGSRKKALEAEEKALLSILEKAETVDEIIKVQDRLSQVRAELESYTQSLAHLQNLVQYSTVNMSIQEVERITTPKQTFGALAGSGFVNSLKNVGAGLRNFAIWLISIVPYLVLIVVVAVPCFFLLRSLRRKRKAHQADATATANVSGSGLPPAPKTDSAAAEPKG
ncbi:MAG: DUF4349 domain-containing protein [Oscillospiraceae bacterium]|jgi:hypothetical protein|nr:DUF4349 domain-containing protein [Oscillospiraceae bacterium]